MSGTGDGGGSPADGPSHGAVVRTLDELDGVAAAPGLWWSPLRDELGFTGAGANVFRAAEAGAAVIERHDETTSGAAGHDELYVVLAGRVDAEIDGERHDAPVGTVIRVPVGVTRDLLAREAGTTVLVVGGPPGAVGPRSAWTRWTRAYALRDDGDPRAAIAELEADHVDHPGDPLIHFHLACLRAGVGELGAARAHLAAANAGDPRTIEWAAEDEDLAVLRGDAVG